MALTSKSQDGKAITDGEYAELTVLHGTNERTLKGIVSTHEHIERIFDDEGYAIGKTVDTRWEISTDDPQHPAIGFLPENVLTRLDT